MAHVLPVIVAGSPGSGVPGGSADPPDAEPAGPAGRLPRHAFLGSDYRLRRCRLPRPVEVPPGYQLGDTLTCRCARTLTAVRTVDGLTWRHRAPIRRPSGLVR